LQGASDTELVPENNMRQGYRVKFSLEQAM
jgi:hypothetical protein